MLKCKLYFLLCFGILRDKSKEIPVVDLNDYFCKKGRKVILNVSKSFFLTRSVFRLLVACLLVLPFNDCLFFILFFIFFLMCYDAMFCVKASVTTPTKLSAQNKVNKKLFLSCRTLLCNNNKRQPSL